MWCVNSLKSFLKCSLIKDMIRIEKVEFNYDQISHPQPLANHGKLLIRANHLADKLCSVVH